jgi:hypothetical protein
MLEFTFLFSTWEIVIKPVGSILDILHRSFNNTFLKRRMDMIQ